MSALRLSRHFRLVAVNLLNKQSKFVLQRPIVRNGGGGGGSLVYRGVGHKEPASLHYAGLVVSSVMWYWILYHIWYEWDHFWPHSALPDPSSLTDEELGIPPDDED